MRQFQGWLNQNSYLILGLLLILFIALFSAIQGVESKKHTNYLDLLRQIRIEGSTYNTEMTRIRFQVHSDYDELLAASRRIYHLTNQLETPPSYLSQIYKTAIRHLVVQLKIQFEQKHQRSSRFQSAKALYNNSVHYIPTLHEEIEHLADVHPEIKLYEQLYHLTEDLLTHISDINHQQDDILTRVHQYRQQLLLESLPPEQHQLAHSALRHIEIIFTALPTFESHLDEVISDETLETISRLRDIYLGGYRALQTRIQVATNLLALFTFALFIALLLAVLNLRKASQNLALINRDLEHRVIERTTALAESKEYAERITESMSEALLVTDTQLQILSCNLATEILSGSSEKRLIHTALSDWLELPQTDSAFTGIETRLTTADGRLIPVELSCAILHSADGKPFRHTYLLHDLRQRKQAEQQQQFLAYQSGIAEMGVTVMHNIGNIITRITGNIELGRQGSSLIIKATEGLARLSDQRQEQLDEAFHQEDLKKLHTVALEALDTTRKSGEVLENICHQKIGVPLNSMNEEIQQIGSLIRLHQTKVDSKIFINQFDLRTLIDDVVTAADDSITQQKIEVTIQCDPALSEITLPRHQLQQMLDHLLQNSIESIALRSSVDGNAPSGAILINGNNNNDRWSLEIQDNGVGLAPEKIDTLFNLGTTTKQGRSGYGLHAVGNFVQRHGGEIHLESEGHLKGALIRATFPSA